MSRRKRRKRNPQKEKEEVELDPFKRFQYELVKTLSRQSFQIFCGNWKLVTQQDWRASDGAALVKKVMDASKQKKLTKYHPLYRALKDVPFPKIKEIYKKHFNRQDKIGREIMVWEIIYKFFGRVTPLEKRDNEKANLDEIKNLDEMIRFINLCGITVPSEIIDVIFSYIPRNLMMICRVGRVCKHFYISFLCAWDHVRVRKRTLYKIPLLVLRSVRSIDVRSGLLASDMSYLCPKLNPDRFRRLVLCGETQRVFNSLKKFKKECDDKNQTYTFANVKELRFGDGSFFWDNEYTSLFPSLNALLGLPPNHLTQPCPSQKLMFKSIPHLSDLFLKGEDGQTINEEEIVEILRENYENVNQLSLGLVTLPNFVNDGVHPIITNCHFKKTIQSFPNIEQLNFYLTNTFNSLLNEFNDYDKRVFDFANFNTFRCLKSLKIGNGFHASIHHHDIWLLMDDPDDNFVSSEILSVTCGAIPVLYRLENEAIETLELDSSLIVSHDTHIIDFNIEDMISNDFFSTRSHNIKNFKIDAPLCSRRRDLGGKKYSYENDPTQVLFRGLCKDIGKTVQNFMKIMSENLKDERYDSFDIRMRTPKGWRRSERWRFRYDKNGKRIRIDMYFEGVENKIHCKNKSDNLSDCDNITIVEEEEEASSTRSNEEFLFAERLPGLLLTREFVTKMLPKVASCVNFVVFDLDFGGLGKMNLWDKVTSFLGNSADVIEDLKESFVFDESSMSFIHLSIL